MAVITFCKHGAVAVWCSICQRQRAQELIERQPQHIYEAAMYGAEPQNAKRYVYEPPPVWDGEPLPEPTIKSRMVDMDAEIAAAQALMGSDYVQSRMAIMREAMIEKAVEGIAQERIDAALYRMALDEIFFSSNPSGILNKPEPDISAITRDIARSG